MGLDFPLQKEGDLLKSWQRAKFFRKNLMFTKVLQEYLVTLTKKNYYLLLIFKFHLSFRTGIYEKRTDKSSFSYIYLSLWGTNHECGLCLLKGWK